MYITNNEKVLFTQLGNEGVLYQMETNEYFTLNETLFKILKGIEEGHTTDEIILNLCQEYEITEIACKNEVTNGIQQLLQKNMIFEVQK